MKILGLSGSLRTGSANTSILHALAALAPEGLELAVYDGLASVPAFNPDLDVEPAPPEVADLRRQLREAAGVVISTPEYAHGIPGSLKNALDWIVSSGEFVDKPVVLINASSGAGFAQAQLIEVLTVMTAKVLTTASLLAPVVRRKMDSLGNVSDPELRAALVACLDALVAAT
jgi:chromate reductase